MLLRTNPRPKLLILHNEYHVKSRERSFFCGFLMCVGHDIHRVKINKGAPGVDRNSVDELDELDSYFKKHQAEIKDAIMKMKYHPQPVRRGYIPKANGKKRPLGIPTVIDRVIQQAVAQVLMKIYDPHFVRYADDCNIFVKSGKSAKRVMNSISSWLERKLFLKVNATKTKVIRPTKSNFLDFTFWKTGESW